MKVHLATSFAARVRGMLGMDVLPGSADVLLIAPCADVHTFGMRSSIDLAFLDEDGVVLTAIRSLAPGRRIRCTRAACVLERFASEDSWFEEGERVSLELRERGE